MYKVNLKFFGIGGSQFSTHFSVMKTVKMKDYSIQCSSNFGKNEKRIFLMSLTLVLH